MKIVPGAGYGAATGEDVVRRMRQRVGEKTHWGWFPFYGKFENLLTFDEATNSFSLDATTAAAGAVAPLRRRSRVR